MGCSNKNKSVLLLGATGFIGSNIAQELNHRGYDWLGVASSRKQDHPNIVTLSDQSEISTMLRNKPVVINAIGGLKPRDFLLDFEQATEEFWQTVQNTLSVLRKGSPRLILQISSAGTVYGEALRKPSEENDPSAPISWYGRMKVIEEALYQQFAYGSGVVYTCARVTNPFGNKKRPKHGFIDVLIDHLRRNATFEACFPEGAARDFIYAPEMAKILVSMVERPVPGVFNVGRSESIPLEKLIKCTKKQLPDAKIESTPYHGQDVRVSSISTRKLFDAYGITPGGPSAVEYLLDRLAEIRK